MKTMMLTLLFGLATVLGCQTSEPTWPDASEHPIHDAAACSPADSGSAVTPTPCHAGTCGAGEICMQYHGGTVGLDTDDSACVRLPCECANAPTCACLAQTGACSLTCAAAGDAAGLNFTVFGEFLCIGE
jgi:hypothetical protein